MDEFRKSLVDNLEKYQIGLDDTFRFHCRECGKCCKNRHDIMLTSRDLFRISRAKGLSNLNTIKDYCDVYIGHDSRIPIVRLNPRGASNACPLLTYNRCSVHQDKPTVCALYPLGRVACGQHPQKGQKECVAFTTQYILNPLVCGSRKKQHTVRGWLERFGIPIEDEFYQRWNDSLAFLSIHVRNLEQKIEGKAIELIWMSVYEHLYLKYDINEEFPLQFVRNMVALKEIIDMAESFASGKGGFRYGG